MRKKPSSLKDLLFLAISSFIVVAAWIGFNLHHSYVTTTITPELQVQIIPINSEFDTATLEKLKTRRQVAPVTELSNQQAAPPAAPTNQPSPEATISTVPVVDNTTQPIVSDIPVTVNGQ